MDCLIREHADMVVELVSDDAVPVTRSGNRGSIGADANS